MMQDKFFMEQQDNLFYAKRNIVDSIYSQSKLEGIAVTFPEVQEIYEAELWSCNLSGGHPFCTVSAGYYPWRCIQRMA